LAPLAFRHETPDLKFANNGLMPARLCRRAVLVLSHQNKSKTMSMNKIALITGASRGLGKDMALRLARKGVDVIITYRSQQEEALAVVREIEATGRKAVALPLDMSNLSGLNAFAQAVAAQLKTLWNTDGFDFLVNNAGIGGTCRLKKCQKSSSMSF
jgi:NAD(P)-dependent dehydrogenase (short-subunit alcohol dehydrogenase family)